VEPLGGVAYELVYEAGDTGVPEVVEPALPGDDQLPPVPAELAVGALLAVEPVP
jgi:hypothetical protein